jgi:hypothetical protein
VTIYGTTQKAQLELSPDGSSHTGLNLQVDGHISGFRPPYGSRLGVRTGPEPCSTSVPIPTRTPGKLLRPGAITSHD